MLDFPDAPTDGQEFAGPKLKWYWNGARWGFTAPTPPPLTRRAADPTGGPDNEPARAGG